MQPTRHWMLVALLACAATVACAQEPQAPNATATSGKRGEVAVQDTIKGPTLTLDEFKALVFKVIDGIDSREKLTQDNLERIIGLKLSPNPREPDIRSITGNGADGWWRWNVNIVTYTTRDTRLRLSAGPQEVDGLGNSPKCVIDYPAFHERMKRMGFEDAEWYGPQGKGTAWKYTRAGQLVEVFFYYTGEPFAVEGRCVSWIDMNFDTT